MKNLIAFILGFSSPSIFGIAHANVVIPYGMQLGSAESIYDLEISNANDGNMSLTYDSFAASLDVLFADFQLELHNNVIFEGDESDEGNGLGFSMGIQAFDAFNSSSRLKPYGIAHIGLDNVSNSNSRITNLELSLGLGLKFMFDTQEEQNFYIDVTEHTTRGRYWGPLGGERFSGSGQTVSFGIRVGN